MTIDLDELERLSKAVRAEDEMEWFWDQGECKIPALAQRLLEALDLDTLDELVRLARVGQALSWALIDTDRPETLPRDQAYILIRNRQRGGIAECFVWNGEGRRFESERGGMFRPGKNDTMWCAIPKWPPFPLSPF